MSLLENNYVSKQNLYVKYFHAFQYNYNTKEMKSDQLAIMEQLSGESAPL